jgi:hypothetical protein
MSKREALARFHTWCAAGYRKAETRRLWSSGCVMSTQRSPLTNVLRFFADRAAKKWPLRGSLKLG